MLDLCKCNWPKLPLVRKCCFCVPIRRGVTIFAYINLVLSLLFLPFLIFVLVDHFVSNAAAETENKAVELTVHLPMSITFITIDVIMTIVLLVGAHKKSKRLLQFYFYFDVSFQTFTFCLDLYYLEFDQYEQNLLYITLLSLNVYLLFLVYNIIRIIEEESAEVQYVVYQEDRQPIIF